MQGKNPYRGLPRRHFWKPSVADVSPFDLVDLYRKKFEISADDGIAAAGSCFAQHIARWMRRSGYGFLDLEPPPHRMPPARMARFGYRMYSARYGNVYTARQLLQLFQRATGVFSPIDAVWEKDGRFVDPFRPQIEPDGFASRDEFEAATAHHLDAVRTLLTRTDVFVFTLGLTEAWRDRRDGAVYPVAPGTAAGEHDPALHEFHNFGFEEILSDLREAIALARSIRPGMRFLLTVSPVPLVATATDQHVLVATTYSKSVLRAVAGALSASDPDVDYFPSYEIITGIPSRSMFFDPDLRNVNPKGVEVVMKHFFKEHPPITAAGPVPKPAAPAFERDVHCDEMVLAKAAP